MIIEEKDFKLEFDEDHSRFDLYLLKTINAKDPEKRRDEFVLRGYGYTLSSISDIIINYRISKKVETISFKKYIEMYLEESKELKSLIESLWRMSIQMEKNV